MAFFFQSTVVCDDCGHVPHEIPDARPVRQYRSRTYCCINKHCRSFKAQFRITFPPALAAPIIQPAPVTL